MPVLNMIDVDLKQFRLDCQQLATADHYNNDDIIPLIQKIKGFACKAPKIFKEPTSSGIGAYREVK